MKRIHFEKTSSTHLYAKENAHSFTQTTIITANYQTAGIGRKRDPWIAPKNSSLLLSIVYNASTTIDSSLLSQLWSLAVKDALSSLHLPITIKYPNDLMIHKQKLAGILTEMGGKKTITSIGLNVDQSTKELAQIDQPATSLYLQTNKHLDKNKILSSILLAAEKRKIFFVAKK